MGHQQRLRHDRPHRAVCMIHWWVILSVLGAEMGSPPFMGLVAPCFNFPKRPASLKTESWAPDIVKNLRRSRNVTSTSRFKKLLKRLSRRVKGENCFQKKWATSGNMWYYILISKRNEPYSKWKFVIIIMVEKNDDINGWNEKT